MNQYKKGTLSHSIIFILTLFNIQAFAQSAKLEPLQRQNFHLGINGHPLNTFGEYAQMSKQKQMRLLKKMSIGNYRFDVTFNDDCEVKKKGKLDTLIREASRNSIELLPVLSQSGLKIPTDTVAAFNMGRKIGRSFSLNYGNDFRVVEIGNEMEIGLLKERSLSGTLESHYNLTKFKSVANFLQGLNSGLKENSKTILTIINFGESHYGFIRLLKQYNIDYDFIGHHWYYFKPFEESGYSNIVEEVSKIQGDKPIMITEFNYAEGSSKVSEEEQAKLTQEFIGKVSNDKRIAAAYFYELLDESSLVLPQNKHYEKHLGLFKYVNKNVTPKKILSSKLKINRK